MLGPSNTEANWLLTIDCTSYRDPYSLKDATEQVLEELRNSLPAPGFKKVEIPRERERNCRKASKSKIHITSKTWRQILDLETQLNKP